MLRKSICSMLILPWKTIASIHTFLLAVVLHPQEFKKAQEEIDRVVGRNRLPTIDDRPSLPYLECLLKEVLRWVHDSFYFSGQLSSWAKLESHGSLGNAPPANGGWCLPWLFHSERDYCPCEHIVSFVFFSSLTISSDISSTLECNFKRLRWPWCIQSSALFRWR